MNGNVKSQHISLILQTQFPLDSVQIAEDSLLDDDMGMGSRLIANWISFVFGAFS